jgi:hypothetical protein
MESYTIDSKKLPYYFNHLYGFPKNIESHVSKKATIYDRNQIIGIWKKLENALLNDAEDPLYGVSYLINMMSKMSFHGKDIPMINRDEVVSLPTTSVTLGELLIATAQHLIMYDLPFDLLDV